MAKFKDIDKVLELVAKTGDKVIIMSETQEPMVIMGFRDYDHLLISAAGVNHLTEAQLMDKINRDIAIWKAAQPDANYNLDEFRVDELAKKWVDSPKTEPKVEENTTDLPAEEEDKYYIEPVD